MISPDVPQFDVGPELGPRGHFCFKFSLDCRNCVERCLELPLETGGERSSFLFLFFFPPRCRKDRATWNWTTRCSRSTWRRRAICFRNWWAWRSTRRRWPRSATPATRSSRVRYPAPLPSFLFYYRVFFRVGTWKNSSELPVLVPAEPQSSFESYGSVFQKFQIHPHRVLPSWNGFRKVQVECSLFLGLCLTQFPCPVHRCSTIWTDFY